MSYSLKIFEHELHELHELERHATQGAECIIIREIRVIRVREK